jgi:ArsR family transcriptional regulator, zinc-responsive transcriptional repressor
MPKTVMQASEQDLDQLSSLFRVLSDKTRLQILLSLADGEKNVTMICDSLKLPQPTVSHHLALLRMNNVVGHRRDGKQVFYGLDGRVNFGGGGELVLSVQNLIVRIGVRTK